MQLHVTLFLNYFHYLEYMGLSLPTVSGLHDYPAQMNEINLEDNNYR